MAETWPIDGAKFQHPLLKPESALPRQREGLRQELVGISARCVVEHHGGDHHLVGMRCIDQSQQSVLDAIGATDRQTGAMARQPFAIARRIRIGCGRFRRFQRAIFPLGAADVVQFRAGGDALRFRIGIRRDRRGAENGVRAASIAL